MVHQNLVEEVEIVDEEEVEIDLVVDRNELVLQVGNLASLAVALGILELALLSLLRKKGGIYLVDLP